ncbi:MAG: reverse transcriptase family protein, partial [Sedimenticola sp.]
MDTGAAVTVISSNVYNKLPSENRPQLMKVGPSFKLEVANDELLQVQGYVDLEFNIQKDTFHWRCFVAPIREDGLLGLDFLQANKYVLSADSGLRLNKKKYSTIVQKVPFRAIRVSCQETTVLPAYSEMVISGTCDGVCQEINQSLVSPLTDTCDEDFIVAHTLVDPNRVDIGIPVRVMNTTSSDVTIPAGKTLGLMHDVVGVATICNDVDKAGYNEPHNKCVDEQLPGHLTELYHKSCKDLCHAEKQQLKQLLMKHADVFAKSASDVGRTSVLKHKIETGDNVPIKQRPRRPPMAFANEEDKIIDSQLKAGIIRESTSPWASPLVYVRKKDGTTRPCVDYRKVNAVSKADAFPLPNITDCLDSLSGSSLFSCVDLQSGYWQVEVEESDKPKTAFVCRKGLYEYNTLPFGLSGAGATFQRCMELVMRGLQWLIVIIYLDDLIIHAKTFPEHLRRLDHVFTRLKAAGLKLKCSKCSLLQKEVGFLGHVVTEDGVKPDMSKVRAIQGWPVPKCVRDVRAFLGFGSYYRRFIRNFSTRASPMNRLLEAGRPFMWTDECQESFEDLKSVLT